MADRKLIGLLQPQMNLDFVFLERPLHDPAPTRWLPGHHRVSRAHGHAFRFSVSVSLVGAGLSKPFVSVSGGFGFCRFLQTRA
jgi:hypothetical protein